MKAVAKAVAGTKYFFGFWKKYHPNFVELKSSLRAKKRPGFPGLFIFISH
jgi:hypothetical protein